MASLNAIGLDGYRLLVADAFNKARLLKERIEALPYCKVLNPENPGPSVLWWVFPKGRDAKAIHAQLLAGTLAEEDRIRYFAEIHHLYQKRVETMDVRRDARLSYTSSTGFSPGGHQVPAWKAVFFNPKTSLDVIDQVIESIEELA